MKTDKKEVKKLKNKGFTLIELLIVITLLGILAVAVLSAINPIEQINRSRDTASRSDSEQLLNAVDRFYATRGYYPWVTSMTDDATLPWTPVDTSWVDNGSPAEAVLTKLSSGGTAEVKESFVTRISDESNNPLYIYNEGAQGDSTYVCFNPQSGAFTEEALTRCGDAEADTPEDFPDAEVCQTDCRGLDAGEATGCFVCLP